MKLRLRKIINNYLFPLAFTLVWLMPVSTQKGVLNNELNNRMYILVTIFLALIVLYDLIIFRHLRLQKSLIKVLLVAAILAGFSIPTALMHPEANFGSREYVFYIMMMLVLTYKVNVFNYNSTWRVILYFVTTLICISGVLMVMGNKIVWDFFSTYYVNHYAYAYTQFEQARKPVTFFVANSTTVPVYFLLYILLEICEKENKLSVLLRVILALLIVFCFNNSAIMACGLIVGYYLFNSDQKMTFSKILRNMLIVIGVIGVLIASYSYISEILLSKANGILGRYTSSGAGNLVVDIKYILDLNIPIGCVFIPSLFYADSGPIIYTLMGSIALPIIIYTSLFTILRYYMPTKFTSLYVFISIFAFEFAYPVLIAQRFLPLFAFFLIYTKAYFQAKNSSVSKSKGNKVLWKTSIMMSSKN